ncbi:class I SAM-dependent methyltransferase [Flocculibacter collagenilyticus]|uniref:class I SAM-dependent methyltransferase n=1 Tax=Flocculibacter collagenilyticus TaxID=2744479 RepID=UPI0018F63D8F|nr:class I SAM-dependent methyltransferase [Flocculibacter collagenilyticus]
MDLSEYRESDREKQRESDLLRLINASEHAAGKALDIGARDGHFSLLLASCFENVTALDLVKPQIQHEKITCVKGDITDLAFNDNCFDFVFCAEVLEHISPHLLATACTELGRVANEYILTGVPYKQDLRVGRTTCLSCGKKNPAWGHVNKFDEDRLQHLFSGFDVCEVSYVSKTNSFTNPISTWLLDLAGNPYGTYLQDEPCVYCNAKLMQPPQRTMLQKLFTKASFYIRNIQKPFIKEQANWIHVLFKKK